MALFFIFLGFVGIGAVNAGGRPCDTHDCGLPNLVTAMLGYDVGLSDPFKPFGDPGLRLQIFAPTHRTNNGYYMHPFVAKAVQDYRCTGRFSSTSFKTYTDYMKEKSSDIKWDVGASYEASASFLGFSAEVSANYRYSESAQDLSVKRFFEEVQGEMEQATAVCHTHIVEKSTLVEPMLTSHFKRHLVEIDKVAKSSNESRKNSVFTDFVKQYGTHYQVKTTLGAKIVFQRMYATRSKSNGERNERSKCAKHEAEGCAGAGFDEVVTFKVKACASGSHEKCQANIDESSNLDQSGYESKRVITVGSAPSSSIETWGDNLGKVGGVLLGMKLQKITNLFTKKIFEVNNITSETGAPLDPQLMTTFINDSMARYCELLLGHECPKPPSGCGINDSCGNDEACIQDVSQEFGYRCGEKLWRDDGRCGQSYPLPNGEPGQCHPTAYANEKGPCCSKGGWCGNSNDHCTCSSCVNYADDCVQEDNITYSGNNLHVGRNYVKTDSAHQCARWCGVTDGCKFWTFQKSQQGCWLKYANAGRRSDSDAISGTKSCSKGTTTTTPAITTSTPTTINAIGEVEFRLVPKGSPGVLATVAEVRANKQKAMNVLNQWTIARLDGGKIFGPGHGGRIHEGDFSGRFGEKLITLQKFWRDDGRCGQSYPLPNGKPGECDPTANADKKGPCCSPYGWCGNSDDHCTCKSCVNYAEKRWRNDGRCGQSYPLYNGKPGECDPTANADKKGPCCSPYGWCGNSDDHCTCESCVNYAGSGCFPGVSQVMLEGGEKKSMEDLRVGDVIVSMDSGKLVSTIVLGFLDKRINQTTEYLNLNIEDGRSLFISPTHAIFIKGDDNSIKSVLAKEVNPGDMVVTEKGFSRVKLVTVVVKSGAYVPLTDAGTLIVDGVLVSCYTNAPHWLAHIVLAPLRWWPTLLLDTEESQHSEGVKAYPWMVKNLGNFLGLADVSVPNDKIESVDFPKREMSSPRLTPNKMDKYEL